MRIPISMSILSKDDPKQAINAANLLKQAAHDTSNFKLSLVIDNNQIDMYQSVLKAHPDMDLVPVPSTEKGLRKCFIGAFEHALELGGYFMMALPHDVYGVVNHWDRYVTEKVGFFEDDLLSLFSHQDIFGRSPAVLEGCYCISYSDPNILRPLKTLKDFSLDPKKPINIDFVTAFEFCELFPCVSYKVAEFVLKFYKADKQPFTHDLVVSIMLQQLFRKTGENRNVFCWPDSFRVINDLNSDIAIRKSSYDLSTLMSIVDEMAEYVIKSKWTTWEEQLNEQKK